MGSFLYETQIPKTEDTENNNNTKFEMDKYLTYTEK